MIDLGVPVTLDCTVEFFISGTETEWSLELVELAVK